MKAVFIVFNQANTERMEYMLDELSVRGFTFFENVQGRGHESGDPHRGICSPLRARTCALRYRLATGKPSHGPK